MLLLMRRVGESLRVGEDLVLTVEKVQENEVILAVHGSVEKVKVKKDQPVLSEED